LARIAALKSDFRESTFQRDFSEKTPIDGPSSAQRGCRTTAANDSKPRGVPDARMYGTTSTMNTKRQWRDTSGNG
jgi:hypothetical protein